MHFLPTQFARSLFFVAVVLAILVSGCSPERVASHRFCKMWKKCQKDQFSQQYKSVRQCTKLRTLKRKADTYESIVFESRECAKAQHRYDRCYAKELTCDYFLSDAPTMDEVDAAEDWIDSVQDACGEELDELRSQCE